ncbi:MAG TPA: DUF503 domain-containing protein [Acidobacteriota bacterium]|jgi:hypothetical protein|nr:DUF503 domain-containing protein [Acidobacteriota bacterium]HRR27706.1 DUF503 domain-containing protein [Acidobacteriota bacterium]HRR56058.1 DUF503 domain-containing protein [Acidobacteriota bacterium]
MPVLFCSLELYLPGCHSLKEKRKVIQSAAAKLRTKFQCSVSELEHHDLWQRSRLGLAIVGNDRTHLNRMGERIREECEYLLAGDLLEYWFEILEHD